MGLAASQARFLGITLRKANCEFKSTELAQQRLELTNQMTDIAQEYANALNATKLVWHNDLVCDSFGNPMDYGLSYSLLMMPSAANDYNPFMITSKSGAIILSSKYADAAEYAGISMGGGVATAEGRNKFIAALANVDGAQPANPRTIPKSDEDNRVITELTYNILTRADKSWDPNGVKNVDWNATAGMGGTPLDKTYVADKTLADLMLDADIGQHKIDWSALPNVQNVGDMFQTDKGEIHDSKLTMVVNDVIKFDANYLSDMKLVDLMKNNVVIMGKNADDLSQKMKDIIKEVAEIFGYKNIGNGINVDTTSDAALDMALKMVEKKVLNPGNIVDAGGMGSLSYPRNNSAYTGALEWNRICQVSGSNCYGVSLTNVINSFLTFFDNYLRGSDSGYVVGKSNADGRTIFVTDDPEYLFVTDPDTEVTNEEKIADFYNELYNNICSRGWRYDDMVLDSEYMESAIKDGRYQIMGLNNDDGYFYQERYNQIPYLVEEQDDDAIARAEVDYTTKKAQITFKEDQIDVKTKKLDAEISELNTEINSVQNIISKSIEKTFSMFSN